MKTKKCISVLILLLLIGFTILIYWCPIKGNKKNNNTYIKEMTSPNNDVRPTDFVSRYSFLSAEELLKIGSNFYKEKKYAIAIEWYQKAAEQNNADAQYILGVMYDSGYGVEKNYTKAIEWYQKAAEQNLPEAQYHLGVMYYHGHGVEKNYTKAIEWFQKAAEQNLHKAQYNLGLMYRQGKGTEKNYSKAIKWFQKAAKQNDIKAKLNLLFFKLTRPNLFTTASNQTTETNVTPQKRIALIIGNGDYANGRLSNPTNDAQDITKKLKSLGFETTGRTTNLKLSQMNDDIAEFCKKAKGYDAAIFYYAGHAMQDKGINYLVPIEAQIKSNADIEYECVDMNWVLRSMEEAGIKTKIIILDACRNNPVAQSWERSFSSSGLTAITSVPEGTFLVFAAQAGRSCSFIWNGR